MKKLFSVLALTGATTAGAFAACDHSCNEADTLFYVGLGVGGEHGMHDYKLQDIANNIGEKKVNKLNALGQILTGVRYMYDSNWFVGLGLEANLGRSEAEYKEGANSFITDDQSSFTYPSGSSRSYRYRKDYDLEANLQAGCQLSDTKLYGKIGISHTRFKYSFKSLPLSYMNTSFENKSKNTVGFVPGLGIEQRVSHNTWCGLEVSMPFYKKNKVVTPIRLDDDAATGELTAIEGKTNNLKFMFNVKVVI